MFSQFAGKFAKTYIDNVVHLYRVSVMKPSRLDIAMNIYILFIVYIINTIYLLHLVLFML